LKTEPFPSSGAQNANPAAPPGLTIDTLGATIELMTAYETEVAWTYAAIRTSQHRIRASVAVMQMGIVTCEQCDAQFLIGHEQAFADTTLAARQAAWLEQRLAHDHQSEAPHEDAVPLPSIP
jgi:hypothetical protein